MKKTYIIPETLMAELSTCSILTLSDGSQKSLSDSKDAPYGVDAEVKGSMNAWDEEW
jgi:hypothetical protein